MLKTKKEYRVAVHSRGLIPSPATTWAWLCKSKTTPVLTTDMRLIMLNMSRAMKDF